MHGYKIPVLLNNPSSRERDGKRSLGLATNEHEYSLKWLLKLGLIFREFEDAIKRPDKGGKINGA